MRLIDAEELLEQMRANFRQDLWDECDDFMHSVVEETIMEAPAIDPESLRARGEWRAVRDSGGVYVCSECMAIMPHNTARFCPQCGAKMQPNREETEKPCQNS